LSSPEAGRKIVRISELNVRHPPNLTLQQLSPTTVRITARKAEPEPEEKKG